MNSFKLIEKLGAEGYSTKELSIVYYDAIINKHMKEEDITEDYLISNLCISGDIKLKVDKDILLNHYSKQLDFIYPNHGIVFLYEMSNDQKTAIGISREMKVFKVNF